MLLFQQIMHRLIYILIPITKQLVKLKNVVFVNYTLANKQNKSKKKKKTKIIIKVDGQTSLCQTMKNQAQNSVTINLCKIVKYITNEKKKTSCNTKIENNIHQN